LENDMNETRAVKDLAIGDLIQVQGFEGNLTVRSAKKIKKGLDAGKLQVTLATADGDNEVMGFNPEEEVKVVGKGAETAGKAKGGKDQGAGKGKVQGKGKGKTKAMAEPEGAAATPAPETQTAEAPAPDGEAEPKAKTTKQAGRAKKAESGKKKLSALDAAAKVLAEAGTAMNCQELIKVLAEKNLWTSPGGKTPAATLYSAILREVQTKGNEARFRKTERGKFEAANTKA
jgi:hypothetical protein